MQVPTPRLVLALAGLLLLGQAAHAENWARFRGPNGTGVSNDKNIPVKWEKDNFLWKVALPGTGHSSPIVWGDRLFVQTANTNERLLLCLDVKDGRTVWKRSAPGVAVKIHGKNSLASMTPATDGERVYAIFWDGREIILSAFDFQGNPVWSRNLGKYTSQHGAGHSPVVVGDKVIFANDQDGYARLLAFDVRTGKTAWEQERPAFRACYSAPFLIEKKGQPTELCIVSTMGITGYDPNSGSKKWNHVWKFYVQKPLRTTASALFTDNRLIACAGDGNGDRHMITLDLNGGSPKVAWENRKDFPYVPTPVVRGEHIYFANDRGVAGCYRISDGQQVWYERLTGATFASSPVLVNGKMYVASEQGDVFVIDAEPKFHPPVRNSLGELIRATPAVSNGRLFVRGENHLFCIGQK